MGSLLGIIIGGVLLTPSRREVLNGDDYGGL